MDTILASLISGIVAIVVCIINSRSQMRDLTHKLELAQAVTDTKLEELTREVRSHNNYGERLISLEERVKNLEKGDDGR
jgi:hypothetical protein